MSITSYITLQADSAAALDAAMAAPSFVLPVRIHLLVVTYSARYRASATSAASFVAIVPDALV